MSRYIDADNLLSRTIYDVHHAPYITKYDVELEPTADVRENLHGEWVKDEGGFDPRDCFYHCSKCGRTINIICGDTLENYPFCHCGADMRKGETNG